MKNVVLSVIILSIFFLCPCFALTYAFDNVLLVKFVHLIIRKKVQICVDVYMYFWNEMQTKKKGKENLFESVFVKKYQHILNTNITHSRYCVFIFYR